MPGTRTTESLRAQTEAGRRVARFRHALERARRIVAQDPPLSADELTELAAIYRPDLIKDPGQVTRP